jgi:hypothetical protein
MAVLLAVGATLGFASTAWAATNAPSLRLVAAQAPSDSPAVALVAPLTRPVGSSSQPGSFAGDSVSCSVHLDQCVGAPLLTIGAATTTAAGTATFTYQPTWTGRQALVATVTDAAGNTLASATTSFSATSAAQPFAGTVQAVRPDGTIGQAVAGVLLAIVVVVWIALIAIVVRVNLGLGSPNPLS